MDSSHPQLELLHLLTKDKLQNFWIKNIKNNYFYHGTNNKALTAIQKNGFLSNTNRIWDDDFYELEKLLIKAGNEYGFGTRREGVVFITGDYAIAQSYSLRSPETWSYFIGEQSWKNKDKKLGLNSLRESLINEYYNNKKTNLEIINSEKFDINKHSKLTIKEINTAKMLFDKYWSFFKEVTPVILTFNSSIADEFYKIPFFSEFSAFEELVNTLEESTGGFIIHACQATLEIEHNISLDYLINVEQF